MYVMKPSIFLGSNLKLFYKTQVKNYPCVQQCIRQSTSHKSKSSDIYRYHIKKDGTKIITSSDMMFCSNEICIKLNKRKLFPISNRYFHTSKPNNALPGLVYLLVKPILRVGAIVIAKITKKVWSNLTPKQKKEMYLKIRRNQSKILGFSLSGIGLAYLYYFLHLETCPITGRQKFLIVKPNQLNDIVRMTYETLLEEHGKHIVPQFSIAHKRVANVLNRLIKANKTYMVNESRKLSYKITIIDDPNVNAFVLPDGSIFIFTGMLKMCSTDDELATVLSHELSHTLLNHVAEKLSKATFFEILFVLPVIFIWILLPNISALVTQNVLYELKSIIFELPFDREMETEADEVGLKLMATACFDVRVASLFWKKMKEKQLEGPEFWSTHPSHENRQHNLEEKLSGALKLRKECNCLPLGPLSSFNRVLTIPKNV